MEAAVMKLFNSVKSIGYNIQYKHLEIKDYNKCLREIELNQMTFSKNFKI